MNYDDFYICALVRSEDCGFPSMLPLLGVVLSFVLIVALRLRNVDFSASMLLGSVIIAATSGGPLEVLVEAASRTVTDQLL